MKLAIGFVLGIATAVCFLAYSGGKNCFALAYLALYAPPIGWVIFAVGAVMLIVGVVGGLISYAVRNYPDLPA